MSDETTEAQREAAEQAELNAALQMESERDLILAPKGWIGPVEALRREHKIRELQQRVRDQTPTTLIFRPIDTAPQDGRFFLGLYDSSPVPIACRPVGPGSEVYESFWGDGGINKPDYWCAMPATVIARKSQ